MPKARSKPKVVTPPREITAPGEGCGAPDTDKQNGWSETFSNMACAAAHWMGKPIAFLIALLSVIVWAATGPIFHYSDTWQLVINTSTTIVTFLMVFLIQRTQNKDALALQIKLNEIIAAMEGASNRLIAAEDLTEEELKALEVHFERLAEMAKKERRLTESHSIEEAEARHEFKRKRR